MGFSVDLSMLVKGVKTVSHIDLGWSEDEYNNLLIDCWTSMNKKSPLTPTKYQYFDAVTGEIVESDTPISVTIQLQKHNHS